MSQLKEEEVIKQIIEAAKIVFKQYGYKKVTMNDISEAAKKGRSTLYHYFKNKKEVFEEVAIKENLLIVETGLKDVSRNNSLSVNLTNYHRSKLDQLVLTSKEYVRLFEDVRNNQELTIKVDRATLDLETKYTKEMLQWAIEKKEISSVDEDSLSFLSRAMVTAMSGLGREMIFFGSIPDLGNRTEWLIELMVKGLK
ncbi:TetR/AcrR family transcriptional regulator [Reichenbachiella versicolor]|uniref:TetR/AcrR family transcriptional regulator n=1 Tax=Reichenbachiella versicolor TaxID=1821036 RepID=UPI000D6DDC2B|nr:helix-turn-helix domain-containing protein [Reichenbachiella versicolor]